MECKHEHVAQFGLARKCMDCNKMLEAASPEPENPRYCSSCGALLDSIFGLQCRTCNDGHSRFLEREI